MELIKKVTFGPGDSVYSFRPNGNFHEKVIEFLEKAPFDGEFKALLRDDGDWDHGAEYYTFLDKEELIEFLKNPKVAAIESIQVTATVGGEDALFTVKYIGGGDDDCRVFATGDDSPPALKLIESFK